MLTSRTRSLISPLAGCLTSTFALSISAAHAGTVSNCYDSGAGSLRDTVAAAASGDLIDMTGLTPSSPGCNGLAGSTISLSTGAVVINQNSLTIAGPSSNMDILASAGARVFTHNGTGVLGLSDVTLKYGQVSAASGGDIAGGCISSNGYLTMTRVRLEHCHVAYTGPGPLEIAMGGGAYAKAGIYLRNSVVSYNTVNSTEVANGGGLAALSNINVKYSTISNNSVHGDGGGSGGGLNEDTGTAAHILNSTISGNYAPFGGGITLAFLGSAYISGSTISGNTSALGAPGGYVGWQNNFNLNNSTISGNSTTTGSVSALELYPIPGGVTTVSNSTIANNQSGSAGPALSVVGNSPVTLISNIIASNIGGGVPEDFCGGTVTVSSVKNLIFATTCPIPADTLVGKCPLLYPLAANGGPTLTRRIESHSPATDAGADGGFIHDQRGAPYVRVSGSAADIGTYEIDQTDIVFDSQFEGCP
jgi:hypothetical protein